jgi:hypothetical protein
MKNRVLQTSLLDRIWGDTKSIGTNVVLTSIGWLLRLMDSSSVIFKLIAEADVKDAGRLYETIGFRFSRQVLVSPRR